MQQTIIQSVITFGALFPLVIVVSRSIKETHKQISSYGGKGSLGVVQYLLAMLPYFYLEGLLVQVICTL